jgi:hypothetical protein
MSVIGIFLLAAILMLVWCAMRSRGDAGERPNPQ